MGLRFRKTFSIIPGVKLNIGKKSVSVRVGVKGFGYTTGTAGKTISVSLPSTGLSFSHKIRANAATADSEAVPALDGRRRRPWFLLAIVYAIAGLIWWTILHPN